MKFVLFVEGPTEKQALPDWIGGWLEQQLQLRMRIKIVGFEGWSDYVKHIRNKVALNLSGKVGEDVIAGIGLLDLYGPTFYPSGVSTVADRYAWAKRHIEQTVAHPKFRQHFAVHETEAWLLADPSILPAQVKNALPGGCEEPEKVNFVDPPSELLARLYRSRLDQAYKKVTDGANLFQALDPGAAYAKCPYLRRLFDDMVALARS